MKENIGEWYWLIDEKDNLIRICKSLSFNETSSPSNSLDQHHPVESRKLFDYFDGDDIKSLYRDIHATIRSGKKKRIAFVCRCDTPTRSVHMYMVISSFPQNRNFLLYHSTILRATPHNVPLLSKFGKSDEPQIFLCNFCSKVKTSAYNSIRTLNEYLKNSPEDSIVSACRFICSDCRQSFDELLNGTSTSSLQTNHSSELKSRNIPPVSKSEEKSDQTIDQTQFQTKSEIQSTGRPSPQQTPSVSSLSDSPPSSTSSLISSATSTLISEKFDPDLSSAPSSVESSPEYPSQKKTDQKRSIQAQAAGLECLNILFVDDSRLNQCILGRMMKRAGMQISVASSGVDAVSIAREKLDTGIPFDIILMDCVMPGELDGYGATTKIREFSQVPIIAATGIPRDTWEVSYKPSGMNDYLPKPFNIKDVLVLIRKWSRTNLL